VCLHYNILTLTLAPCSWVELLLGSSSPCCTAALLVVGVAEIIGTADEIILVGVLLMGVVEIVSLIGAILVGVTDAIVVGVTDIGAHSGLKLVGVAELTLVASDFMPVGVADSCAEMVLQIKIINYQ